MGERTLARSYYVQVAGETVRGPLSADEVRAAAARGELQPQDFIRDAAHPAWRPLASVAGLTFGSPSGSDDDAVTLREAVAPLLGGVKAVSRGAARLFGHSGSARSEAEGRAERNGLKGSGEPQVVARSFDSPEEARESALRTLASMRAQGQLTEAEYQQRRRSLISQAEPEPPFITPAPRHRSRTSGDVDPDRQQADLGRLFITALLILAVLGGGYLLIEAQGKRESRDRAEKQAELQRLIAERARARQAAAEEEARRQAEEAARLAAAEEAKRNDPKVTFKAYFECVQTKVLGYDKGPYRALLLTGWDVVATSSMTRPVEGRISGTYWSAGWGEYSITITCYPSANGWTAATVTARFTGRRGVDDPSNHWALEDAQSILGVAGIASCR